MVGIRIDRLMADIEACARVGRNAEGGITRPCFSREDRQIRRWFADTLKNEGLDVEIDAAANVWGRLPGAREESGSLVVGSHLDTVPNGGAYDGALGVLMALELARTIMENDIRMSHSLEVVSFTGEEANDFQVSTMGSRCFTGRLTPEALADARDSTGKSLAEAIAEEGGGLSRFEQMWRSRANKEAFLELHIEQGSRLARKDVPVAVVDHIVGIHRERVSVVGSANHAGTTMMNERRDALAAAAEMTLEVEKVGSTGSGDSVATVGRLDVEPNAANIIPGRVEFIVELRQRDPAHLQEMVESVHERWAAIAARRGVSVQRQVMLDQAPVSMDADMVSILQQAIADRDIECATLPSMAGHDAVHMAPLCKTAMIFVRSPNGKSHCPEEYSTPEDIEVVGNVMLDALLRMDRFLKKA